MPRPPLDGLIDDLYYLEGAPPYPRLTLPPMPSAVPIFNLGAPFRIRAGNDIETAEYADGCVVTMPTRAFEFGYPPETRSVGVHLKPWGLAPFLPMPAAELCDRPVTVEQVWGRSAVAGLRDRLATADGPQEMLTLLEQELRDARRNFLRLKGIGLGRRDPRPHQTEEQGRRTGDPQQPPELPFLAIGDGPGQFVLSVVRNVQRQFPRSTARPSTGRSATPGPPWSVGAHCSPGVAPR